MKRKLLTAVVLMLCVSTAFAWYAGLDGKWTGQMTGPTGEGFPITCEFKVEGTALKGTMTSSLGKFELINGIVKGDSLWFTADLKNMKIENKGRYYPTGDSISMRVGSRATHVMMKRVN